VFRNSRCVDCGTECDSRLMPLVCHVLKEKVHPTKAEPFHPLTAVLRHPVAQPQMVHLGTVESSENKEGGDKGKIGITEAATGIATGIATGSIIPVVGAIIPSLLGGDTVTITVVSKWSCCGKSVDSEGCQSQFPCCNQPVTNPGCQEIFQCCSSCNYDL